MRHAPLPANLSERSIEPRPASPGSSIPSFFDSSSSSDPFGSTPSSAPTSLVEDSHEASQKPHDSFFPASHASHPSLTRGWTQAPRTQVAPAARLSHGVFSFLSASLQRLILVWTGQPGLSKATPDLKQATVYPNFMRVCQRLAEQSGASVMDTRACLSSIVRGDTRFVHDTGLKPFLTPNATLSKNQHKLLKRHRQAMIQALVNIKVRRQELWSPKSSSHKTFLQRFAHVCFDSQGNAQLGWDQTLSSDDIKFDRSKSRTELMKFNANLAGIFDATSPQQGRLSMIRSGRTDTPERLRELLVFGALFSRPDQPFRSAIVTALDDAPAKELATRLFAEPESDMLRHQQQAVDAVFGDATEATLGHSSRGPLVVARPLVLQSLTSLQAKNPMARLAARDRNMAAMGVLWHEIALALAQPRSGGLQAAQMLSAAQTPHAKESLMRDPVFLSAVSKLPDVAQSAVDALALHAVGHTLSGDTLLTPASTLQESLLIQAALKVAGRLPNFQCKSGQDRTLSLLGLWMAANANDTWRGEKMSSSKMRTDFSSASAAFGSGPIRDVRGLQGHVKWRFDKQGVARFPVPQALLEPPKMVASLRRVEVELPQTNVPSSSKTP